MWILGNYSRFIRPGAVRMSVETTDKEGKAIRDGDTDQQGLMCSAYRNTDGQWAMVDVYKRQVQPDGEKGDIQVKVSAKGLEDASIVITTY